jgi:hypothetical protein
MTEKEIKKLKKQYDNICNTYVKIFCEKQDMDFEGWVGNDVGSIACCNDFFFDLHDIILDIDTNQEEGYIINWYYDNLEIEDKNINYYSYIKGLRIKDLK